MKSPIKKCSKVVHCTTKNAQTARLSFEHLETQNESILLEIRPSTGRYHQIIARLAHIGCLIIGDSKYGSIDAYKESGIAYMLIF